MLNVCKTCSERCGFPLSTLNFLGYFCLPVESRVSKGFVKHILGFCFSMHQSRTQLSYFNSADGLKCLSGLVGSSGVPGRVAQIDTSGYMSDQLQVSSWPS